MLPALYLRYRKKKTQKGNSYAIVKFSDLSNVFELFIFSEIFEINRDNLKEGNSLMITLIKNYADENKIQKRINVKKIISLKDVIDKPIKNITFKFKNFNDLYKLENLDKKNGQTDVRVIVDNDNEILTFKVKNRRKIDNKLLNSLNLVENAIID